MHASALPCWDIVWLEIVYFLGMLWVHIYHNLLWSRKHYFLKSHITSCSHTLPVFSFKFIFESWGKCCDRDISFRVGFQSLLPSACWLAVGLCVNPHKLQEVSLIRVELWTNLWVFVPVCESCQAVCYCNLHSS